MMGVLFFPLPERMKYIGDHPFVAACSSDLRIRRGLRPYLVSQAFVIVSQLSMAPFEFNLK